MNEKRASRIFFAAVTAVGVMGFGATMAFAGNVTETRPDCVDAGVVLLGDASAPDRIRSFVDARHGIYDVTPTAWDVQYPVNGVTTVYGVKCKSGSVCNDFGHDFANAYPESSPTAFCGPQSMFKDNGH